MLDQIIKIIKDRNACLVAVSKTKPNSAIMRLYEQGQMDFGENRAGELLEKYETLPKDIQWHMIGHLQSKKVRAVAPFVKMIHSVDSLKLLREIQKQASRFKRKIEVLIQIKIGTEISKYGLEGQSEIDDFFSEVTGAHGPYFDYVDFRGVMGMASFVDDKDQIRREFHQLKIHFDYIRDHYFSKNSGFTEISMGMSGDYQIALEEGSTIVRIGSLLFGAR